MTPDHYYQRKPYPEGHHHYGLSSMRFWDGREQSDEPCPFPNCEGEARIQSGYAPDVGRNWLRCCCCGKEWV